MSLEFTNGDQLIVKLWFLFLITQFLFQILCVVQDIQSRAKVTSQLSDGDIDDLSNNHHNM